MAVTSIEIAALLIQNNLEKPATVGNETGMERNSIPVSFAED